MNRVAIRAADTTQSRPAVPLPAHPCEVSAPLIPGGVMLSHLMRLNRQRSLTFFRKVRERWPGRCIK
ncbi:hypothetical protein ARTHRO9AX_20029 [Arthrobacter sp. 9AX]|nr:hypothetical protein ARTHRO9AX_20029 [Arthrobacter sp. 9AX]